MSACRCKVSRTRVDASLAPVETSSRRRAVDVALALRSKARKRDRRAARAVEIVAQFFPMPRPRCGARSRSTPRSISM
jgi:hypothetical protein